MQPQAPIFARMCGGLCLPSYTLNVSLINGGLSNGVSFHLSSSLPVSSLAGLAVVASLSPGKKTKTHPITVCYLPSLLQGLRENPNPSASQGGGLSPGKLRNMLLGVEKRGKEELQSVHSSTFDALEAGISSLEGCKDVIECSSSTSFQSANTQMADHRVKEFTILSSRHRHEEGGSLAVDYDSGQENASVASSGFEFHKAERVAHRVPLAPFSKSAPSKWDDAQKWIASPTYNRPRNGQSQAQIVSSSRTGFLGYGNRQVTSKIVVDVPEEKFDEEEETKRIDLDQTKKEVVGLKNFTWCADPFPVTESYAITNSVNLSRHDSAKSIHSAATFIPSSSTEKSISMRDMGTEMTPIPSQEPSRTGTPMRPATPLRSPNSSRTATPGRGATESSSIEAVDRPVNLKKTELSDRDLHFKTRREIVALGKQLGKMNIAAWASKAEEDKETALSEKNTNTDLSIAARNVDTRTSAWEEAEKSKYIARYQREEIRIEAWENHQKAKAEAAMRKKEVEIERMRARVHERLVNKLAALRCKAEEKRVAAEETRNRQATRIEEQAENIRRTGKFSSWFCRVCCS